MINRVLHIVPSLNYVSGISKVLMNYYKLIDKEKFQFDFMYIDEIVPNYNEIINSMGGRCFFIGNIKQYSTFKKNITKFCKEHVNEYSIIHLHMPFLSLFFYDLKKKLKAKAFVIHAHNTKYGNTPITNFRNKIFYKLFPYKADSYFACSNQSGMALFKNNYVNNGFFMFNIINPKELDKRLPKELAKKELSLTHNIVIGHVGIFHYPKNHLFMIDIISEIIKKNPNYRLLLVGDGSLMNDVMEYAKQKNVIDYVIFAGAQVDVYKYYSAMDVFILPSLFEGFPMSFIEAQSFNVPCVVSDIIVPEANINKEINRYLSLNDLDNWVKCIFDLSNCNTENTNQIFKNMIYEKVSLLENKYISLIK